MSAFTYYLILAINTIHHAEPIQGYNILLAKENEFPYVASIGLKRDDRDAVANHKCTGVLITKKHILTAAHCLKNITLDEIQVILGSRDLMKGTKFDVDFRITYNQWANNTESQNKVIINDIAIMKLREEVDELVAKPAKRSCKKYGELIGRKAIITGWGVPNGKEGVASRYLQKAIVTIYPQVDCVNSVSQLRNKTLILPKRLFCTKTDPYTLLTCGDSGGPILAEDTVIGINKGTCPNTDQVLEFPEEFIKSHKINWHARIDYFKKFIDDVIEHTQI